MDLLIISSSYVLYTKEHAPRPICVSATAVTHSYGVKDVVHEIFQGVRGKRSVMAYFLCF
jgi:hypothetical protein